MILLYTIEGSEWFRKIRHHRPLKNFWIQVWEKIRFKHYSLTMEKWSRLHKASSAPDRLAEQFLSQNTSH